MGFFPQKCGKFIKFDVKMALPLSSSKITYPYTKYADSNSK